MKRINFIFLNIFFLKGYIRASFLKYFLGKIGKKVCIQSNFMHNNINNIELGNYVFINHHVELNAHKGKIKIGNFVMIGPHAYISTTNHGISSWEKPMYFQEDNYESIEIEDDVWIGTKAVILAGVRIKRGAVVAAGAVVTKDVEPYSVVGGVPAKHIKYRISDAEIKKAKQINLN